MRAHHCFGSREYPAVACNEIAYLEVPLRAIGKCFGFPLDKRQERVVVEVAAISKVLKIRWEDMGG